MRTAERKNRYQSKETELLKVINTSLTKKRGKGWSRNTGAGFLAEEIKEVFLDDELIKEVWEKGKEPKQFFQTNLCVVLKWGHTLNQMPKDYNLRETEEIVKYLKKKMAENQMRELEGAIE